MSFTLRQLLFRVSGWAAVNTIVSISQAPCTKHVLIECFLYGDKNLTDDVNRSIVELTLEFIHRTGRFD